MILHPDIERIALLGWRVVPAAASKKGLWKGYLDHATTNLDTLERWQHDHAGCCWKVVPQGSGVWALDVDVPSAEHAADGVAVIKAWVDAHGPLPARPHGRSRNGGHLCVFAHTGEAIRSKSGHPAPGIDPRAGRNAFTVSPSPGYRWTVAPWDVAPPKASDWLLKLVQPPPELPKPAFPRIETTDIARRVLFKSIGKILNAGEGQRNDTLNRQAFPVARYVAAGLMSEREATEALYAAARQIGLPHAEITATIQSAFRSGYARPMVAHV